MTKEEVLELIMLEDLFTGENNAETKEWTRREDALKFINEMDEGSSHLLDLMLKNIDDVWEKHRDLVDLAEVFYKKAPHIADAIKKESYKTSIKHQDTVYMMIEDLLLEFVDIDGMKDMREFKEERDPDWYYEEMKIKERFGE